MVKFPLNIVLGKCTQCNTISVLIAFAFKTQLFLTFLHENHWVMLFEVCISLQNTYDDYHYGQFCCQGSIIIISASNFAMDLMVAVERWLEWWANLLLSYYWLVLLFPLFHFIITIIWQFFTLLELIFNNGLITVLDSIP